MRGACLLHFTPQGRRRSREDIENGTKHRIVVGVSGGVDSTYAALSLKEAGYDVRGVHLQIKSCEDGTDARRLELLQDIAGIPVITLECQNRFERDVITPFLEAYRHGATPNPCVICNEAFKIRVLIEQARLLGADLVATGHYARSGLYNGSPAIERTGTKKDQTYVLYRLKSEWLPMLCFPMAQINKREARKKIASAFREEGIDGGRESQDICFLEGRSLEEYLREHLGSVGFFEGYMTDDSGRRLARHRGLIFYTEGQRKGLGLSCGPWFVRERDFRTGDMRLAHGTEPKVKDADFKNASWQHMPERGRRYNVQTCYRAFPVPAVLTAFDGTSGTVEFEEECGGVSVGQSLVFYDGGILMGGGFITAPRNGEKKNARESNRTQSSTGAAEGEHPYAALQDYGRS